MNKYAYLEELRERIGKLSQYQVDNLIYDYSTAIGKMLDEYMDWDQIMREIGTPKEAARRIFDGKPMYIRPNDMYVSRARERDYPPRKEEKKRGFWNYYFILGLITIPLTIAFFAALFALAVTSWSLIIAGPVALVYSAVAAILAGSPLLFFAYGGAALVVLAVGLLMWWATKQFFWPLKAAFKRRVKPLKNED